MIDIYRIRVQGHLGDRWSEWIGGFTIQRQADETTELIGPIVDQAALHGVLAQIRDLGLPLLSVNRELESPCHGATGGTELSEGPSRTSCG